MIRLKKVDTAEPDKLYLVKYSGEMFVSSLKETTQIPSYFDHVSARLIILQQEVEELYEIVEGEPDWKQHAEELAMALGDKHIECWALDHYMEAIDA